MPPIITIATHEKWFIFFLRRRRRPFIYIYHACEKGVFVLEERDDDALFTPIIKLCKHHLFYSLLARLRLIIIYWLFVVEIDVEIPNKFTQAPHTQSCKLICWAPACTSPAQVPYLAYGFDGTFVLSFWRALCKGLQIIVHFCIAQSGDENFSKQILMIWLLYFI